MKTGCGVFQKTQEAEKLLRAGLNSSEQDMAVKDAAQLGNVIASLVRWQHNHHIRCAFCEATQASAALAS